MTLVLEVELKATWAGITRAIQDLHAQRILIEGDSFIVIG